MYMAEAGGHLVHFSNRDLETRSRRSVENNHRSISDIANHPHVSAANENSHIVTELFFRLKKERR